MAKTFKVKLIKSLIGCKPGQRATVKGLGLGKINTEVTLPDNPSNRGMIFQVQHLLEVQKGSGS
jgi:large subunit ribosomal protein L30